MRGIYCPRCRDRFVERHPDIKQDGTPMIIYPASLENGPEEHARLVTGAATTNLRCDACNAAVELGSMATAISVWKVGQTIAPWETDFVRSGQAPVVIMGSNGKRPRRLVDR